MTKIIFLDIDGVLNSIDLSLYKRSSEVEPTRLLNNVDPIRVGILKWIVDMTDAKIVISSSWRHGKTPDWFIGFFEGFNWCFPPVIGCTPDLDGIRGEEVKTYLDANYNEPPPHVIFDDDSDFYEDQPFIHVSRITGLSLKHAIKAIDYLGLKNKKDETLIEDLRRHATFKRKTTLGEVDL